MKGDDLELLRQLPKERASAGFTEAVLSRAWEMERAARKSAGGSSSRPRWILAAGALVLILAVGFSVWGLRVHSRNDRRRAALVELEQIRSEQRTVARQIDRLRSSAAPTIVYLGGDRDHDFVLDVGRLVQWARETKKSAGSIEGQSPTNL